MCYSVSRCCNSSFDSLAVQSQLYQCIHCVLVPVYLRVFQVFLSVCKGVLVRSPFSVLVQVFGHIHEGYGGTTDGTTAFLNASTSNLQYKQRNPPLVFDVPIPAQTAEAAVDQRPSE